MNTWKTTLAGMAMALAAAACAAHDAGMRMIEVPYGEAAMEAAVWYPSSTPEQVREFGPFQGRVAMGGKPAGGRYPLVLISHGTGGTALNHHVVAEALARQGFVVAALKHPGDNTRDRSLVASARFFDERPRQVSRLLDALLADKAWASMVDPARVAAIGHSAGGYSVAALVGGRAEPQRLRDHCDRVKDDPSCALRDKTVGLTQAGGAEAALPPAASDPVRDARIRAAVLLAPLGTPVASDSLKTSTARIKLVAAEFDELLPARYHADHLRVQLPQGSPAGVAAGAGHFSFISPVHDHWKARLGPAATDPAGFDRAAFHQALAAEIATFLEEALR